MTFDIEAAHKSGYSKQDMIEYLAKESNFDINSANDSGYSQDEILVYLANNSGKEVTENKNIQQQGVKQQNIQPQETTQPTEYDLPSNIIGSVSEPVLNMASGLGSKIASDIAGLGAIPLHAAGLIDKTPEEIKSLVQERGTYQPVTEAGKATTAYNPIALIGQGLGAVAENAANQVKKNPFAFAGPGIGGVLNAALPQGSREHLANFTREAIPQALSIYGTTKAAPKAIGKALEKVTPEGVPIIGREGFVTKAITDLHRAKAGNDAGKIKLAENAFRDIASKMSPEELAQTLKALKGSTTPIIPGNVVTSADAIARGNMGTARTGMPSRFGGELVSLQADLSKIPEAHKILTDPKLRQETARAGILNKGAGTDKAMSKAEGIRESNATRNYGAIRDFLVKADDEIKTLLSRPSMDKALVRAADLAKEKGYVFKLGDDIPEQTITKQIPAKSPITEWQSPELASTSTTTIPAQYSKYPVKSLQYVKMALDNMLENPKDYGIAGSEINAIAGTRAAFIKWLEKKAPIYQKANEIYAKDSIPISRMKLWGKLREKFINPSEKETPGSFFGALRDEQKLIKQATGFKRGKNITEIFDKENSALAAKLAAEMEVELMKKRISSEVTVPNIGKMAEGVEPKIPGMLTHTTTIARWLVGKMAKDADVGVNIAAANILKDPKMLSSVLKTFKPHERGAMFNAIKDIASSKAMTVGAPQLATQQDQGEE